LGKEMQLPKKVWKNVTLLWGAGFVGVALVNVYFVNIALASRKAFFLASDLDEGIELSTLDCATTTISKLCLDAQLSQESWVNFKLFGTMGITFVLILITVIFVSKYIKEKS
jgi:intracellular septation protein